MMGIVEFLTARLGDDAKCSGDVHAWMCAAHLGDDEFRPDLCDCGWPARVLAEVEAKRAIIAEFRRLTHPEVGGSEDYLTGEARGHWRALRALSRPYADHPDFDPAWQINLIGEQA